ncbi:hypothetical protein CVT24_008946 [Panaeolus cyanescens]|uniref:CRA domain-containing protein n=1 Tax=Panaeolus cyanescens TaxID=181874 RepID=A0A409WCG8_9AGAR|nr:hypothetical protein CVT24_008946 [Panaeolus cyanescens]
MLENWTISDVLGYTSIACWLGAQFPQVVENIRRKSCEGLSLPFLANWLMGDISNLVGCILTNQLPFQTYLATYFVCVDCMLVGQYFYYYKAPKGPPTALAHHIRSATSPAAGGRSATDRGASRYRTLSAVASNVAAAAALAAQQDEQSDLRRSSTRRSRITGGRRRGYEESPQRDTDGREDDEEDNIPTSLLDSFHSEGGRTIGKKRVSWSVERPSTRAASAGPGQTTTIHIISDENLNHPTASYEVQPANLSLIDSSEHNAPLASSTRGSRANRRGSTMVFLGVWVLFGMGSLFRQHSYRSPSIKNTGVVLHSSGTGPYILSPSLSLFKRESVNINLPLQSDTFAENTSLRNELHDEPSGEQILGRIFAWICTTLYLTSRLPQIWKNYARQSVEGLSMYLFVFAFLGNVFYVSSILTSPKRFLPPPQDAEFIKESIPYLLGSAGTLMFDMTIVTQSFIYRPRQRKHVALHRIPDEEQAALSANCITITPALLLSTMSSPLLKPTPDKLVCYCMSYMWRFCSLHNLPQQRNIVIDYLCHSCFTKTANALIKGSTVKHLDADGDEILKTDETNHATRSEINEFESRLKQVELRKQIRTEIMCGRVDSAISLLNQHFPFVLSPTAEPVVRPSTPTSNFEYVSSTSTEPEHLLLNMRILAFSEACRTTPLKYPPEEHDAMDEDDPMLPEEDEAGRAEQQLNLLTRAQKLYAFTNTLSDPQDRATYLKELENVAGLLAYNVPEESPMARYLTLERREAVADQINRAILKRTGQPLISSLELSARYTTLLWGYAHQLGIKQRGNTVIPPRPKQEISDGDNDIVPQFDLHHFLDTKSVGHNT